MPATHPFPQPEASDPDSVADALDSGLLHWVKGEIPEALQCLRAAGAASADAGSEQRAVDLARMADELASKQETAAQVIAAAAIEAPVVAPSATAAPANEAPAMQPPLEESKPQTAPGRSKLPEPPSGPKKFTGSPDSKPGMIAARVPNSGSSQASNPPKSFAPSGDAKVLSGSSTHPSPPSARPPALGSSGVAAKSAGGNGSGLSSIKPLGSVAASAADNSMQNSSSDNGAAESPSPTTTPLPDAYQEIGTASTLRKSASATRAVSYNPTPARNASSSNASATPESRASSRPQGLDHRLASVRVKIERVEADGTVRLRLLDLAATASGEDNALLIINQNLWQELKRGG